MGREGTSLPFAIFSLAGCVSRQDVSGVWKGTIQASAAGGKDKWQGPAELTLNQNGGALTGALVFTHPQGGRVQAPITSGIVSKDAVRFSGQNQFPMGGSIEITIHGKVSRTSLTGTTDMNAHGIARYVAPSLGVWLFRACDSQDWPVIIDHPGVCSIEPRE